MNLKTEQLLAEALRLPVNARATWAGRLIDSLDKDVEEDAELAWSHEIARRVQELNAGNVKAGPCSKARRWLLELSSAWKQDPSLVAVFGTPAPAPKEA